MFPRPMSSNFWLKVARTHLVKAGLLSSPLRSRFGIEEPRILVCGLNPHAGEGGHLGREEIEIIGPVLQQLAADA